MFLVITYLEMKWLYIGVSTVALFSLGGIITSNPLTFGLELVLQNSQTLRKFFGQPNQPQLFQRNVLCDMPVEQVGTCKYYDSFTQSIF